MLNYLVRAVLLLAGLCCLAFTLNAQGITTGAVNGTVTDGEGKPMAGVTIRATHVPTGSISGAISRADGRYNIRGLRSGGPYTIEATGVGLQKQEYVNIAIGLGTDLILDFQMASVDVQTEEVVVTAEGGRLFNASRTGPGSELNEEQITNAPTVNRSLQDLARYNPLAVGTNIGSSEQQGGVNILGQNTRYNNIQVDGAIMNDAFGLPASGAPGGQANSQPISLDAIEELQVSAAPFDIRNSGFTGGLINAVTRGGTNSLSASAYMYTRNEDFAGNSPDERAAPLTSFTDQWLGARVGGPVVENELFFFVSGELKQRQDPREVGINDTTTNPNFPVDAATINEIIQIARDRYGYETGDFSLYEPETQDFKLFGRLDWNLSQMHRLTLRHNFLTATLDRGIDRDAFNLTLNNGGYKFDNTSNQTVLQLNSVLGENMSNELRVSALFVRDFRDWESNSAVFPYMEIGVGGGRDVEFGIDRFSHVNTLDQDVFELTNDFSYFVGDHTLTIGTHNEFYSFKNVFLQDFYGAYDFSSLDDFRNNRPSRYAVSYSTTPGVDEPAAEFSLMQLGFYAQDEWNVDNNLRLNLGVRVDIPLLPDEPANNAQFAADFPGLSTTTVPSGNMLFSPRASFNYDLSDGARTTQLRGGTGIFSGRLPAVWLGNAYQNTGVGLITTDWVPVDSTFEVVTDPTKLPHLPGGGNATINTLDEDLKLPQVWRSSLAFDHRILDDFSVSLEFVYSQFLNSIEYRDIDLRTRAEDGLGTTTWANGDPRPLYNYSFAGGNSANFNRVVELTNKSEGQQYSLSFIFRKDGGGSIIPGLTGGVSYTFGESEDINSGTSSRAISNWQFHESDNPNNSEPGVSDFDIRHRITFDLGYRFDYLDGWATTVSLFFEARSGRPFSYVFNGDYNGDGAFSNDLIFVPDSQDDFEYQVDTQEEADAMWAELDAFIAADETLSEYRGKIMPRNGAREPWIENLDLRLAQEIPTFNGQRISFTLDILNFMNLLNGDWGHQEYVNFQSYSLINVRGRNFETGKPIVTFEAPGTIYNKDNLLSRWQMQFGVRYSL